MRMADWKRGANRAKINDLLDGFPPYSDSEVRDNNLAVNFAAPENGPNIAHDARRQLDNSLLLPDPLFSIEIDHGPRWKKQLWSNIVTKEMNKIIKDSAEYNGMQKSVDALCVAHGIGPGVYRDKYSWRPRARGIEDVLVPGNTLLDMENLPFIPIYEQMTAFELWRQTHGPSVDPAWNMPVVEAAIKWIDEQSRNLMGTQYPTAWSPEKMQDRIKQDGGLYSMDGVPTIDTWHFYWWDDSGKQSGWRKKIILDVWGQPGASPTMAVLSKVEGKYGSKSNDAQFLYDSKNRRVADKLSEIIHFQVANCSNVAPFRYHSVRSLGFLIYSVCHLQNRLRCKFTEATFESLMQYFRVRSSTDAERALKINLTDKTPLPDGVDFVPPEQRWKIDAKLVEMCHQINQGSMTDSSSAYSQDFNSEDRGETATRTMAKVNNTATMVSAMTNQAYTNVKFRYKEICRRFCIKNSRDADVRKFRVNVLRQGVPEEALNSEAWDVQSTRVIGSGNKMLQIGMVDKLMQIFTKLDPTPQRELLREYIAVNSDDYAKAQRWVPDQPQVSSSVIDAQICAGVMLTGSQVGLRQGVNHAEYIEAMMVALGAKIQEIAGRGGVCTPAELMGMQNLAGQTIDGQPVKGNGIANHLQILAQDAAKNIETGQPADNTVKQQVKEFGDHLGILMNEVKAMAQRMQEQMQQQQVQAGPQMDPKDAQKLQAQAAQSELDRQIKSKDAATKTAQKQISFEQKAQQNQQKHEQDMATAAAKTQLELEAQAAKTTLEIEAAKSKPKPNESGD